MEQVKLINVVRLQNGTKAQSIGAKMLFSDLCAYWVLNADKGTGRETFVVFCLFQSGCEVSALKDERKGDFVISLNGEHFTIEVESEEKISKGAD